jgi:hypothetical protein
MILPVAVADCCLPLPPVVLVLVRIVVSSEPPTSSDGWFGQKTDVEGQSDAVSAAYSDSPSLSVATIRQKQNNGLQPGTG